MLIFDAGRREVLEVLRSRNLKLHTTRSWDFMNLTLIAERNPKKESNLVVAILDSGIWPYSELFSSDSPPPLAWENKCEDITCNKYLYIYKPFSFFIIFSFGILNVFRTIIG